MKFRGVKTALFAMAILLLRFRSLHGRVAFPRVFTTSLTIRPPR